MGINELGKHTQASTDSSFGDWECTLLHYFVVFNLRSKCMPFLVSHQCLLYHNNRWHTTNLAINHQRKPNHNFLRQRAGMVLVQYLSLLCPCYWDTFVSETTSISPLSWLLRHVGLWSYTLSDKMKFALSKEMCYQRLISGILWTEEQLIRVLYPYIWNVDSWEVIMKNNSRSPDFHTFHDKDTAIIPVSLSWHSRIDNSKIIEAILWINYQLPQMFEITNKHLTDDNLVTRLLTEQGIHKYKLTVL